MTFTNVFEWDQAASKTLLHMEIMVDLAEDLFFPASLVVGNIMRGERDLNRECRSRVQPRNETQNQTAAVLGEGSTVGINARSERGGHVTPTSSGNQRLKAQSVVVGPFWSTTSGDTYSVSSSEMRTFGQRGRPLYLGRMFANDAKTVYVHHCIAASRNTAIAEASA